jgi:hypothetical protein
MIISNMKKLAFPFFNPFFPFVPLAFWAVPVSATIITNMNMVAQGVVAPVYMTSQFMGAAHCYSIQTPGLPGVGR